MFFFQRNTVFPPNKKIFTFASSRSDRQRIVFSHEDKTAIFVIQLAYSTFGLRYFDRFGWLNWLNGFLSQWPSNKKSLSGLVKIRSSYLVERLGLQYFHGFPDWWRSNFIFIQINLAYCDQAVLKKPPYRLWQLILGIAVHWQMAKQIKLTKQPRLHESKLVAFLHSAMLR